MTEKQLYLPFLSEAAFNSAVADLAAFILFSSSASSADNAQQQATQAHFDQPAELVSAELPQARLYAKKPKPSFQPDLPCLLHIPAAGVTRRNGIVTVLILQYSQPPRMIRVTRLDHNTDIYISVLCIYIYLLSVLSNPQIYTSVG